MGVTNRNVRLVTGHFHTRHYHSRRRLAHPRMRVYVEEHPCLFAGVRCWITSFGLDVVRAGDGVIAAYDNSLTFGVVYRSPTYPVSQP